MIRNNNQIIPRRSADVLAITDSGVTILISEDIFEDINASGIEITSSEQIVICLTNRCSPNDGGESQTINLNELTKLVESDLNHLSSIEKITCNH